MTDSNFDGNNLDQTDYTKIDYDEEIDRTKLLNIEDEMIVGKSIKLNKQHLNTTTEDIPELDSGFNSR